MTVAALKEIDGLKMGRTRAGASRVRSPAQSLAAADLYRLLSLGFSYPEGDLVPSMRRALGALVALGEQGLLPAMLIPLLRAAQRAWLATARSGLDEEYSRLFLGSGPVSLREGGYGGGLRFAGQPFDIADLGGFYLAFGFGPPPTAASPPDHLGTELEYLSLLNLKTALAERRARREEARITRLAMGHFLADHLGRWVDGFDAAMREADAAPAYRTLSTLLRRTIEQDCRRLGVMPVAQSRGNAADPVGGDILECPLATGAVPNPDHNRPGAG